MYIYEKAFKESIALCLSIEREWLLIGQNLEGEMRPSEALHTLDRLIHLMKILERSDAKVKLLHELNHRFEVIESNHQDEEVLVSTLKEQCSGVTLALTKSSRILSRQLISDPFLARFYYRQDDIYHSVYADIWSKQSNSLIKQQTQYWLKQIESVWHACEMILWAVRYSGKFRNITVSAGFHRENIEEEVLKISLIRIGRDQVNLQPSLSLVQHWLVITVYQMEWLDSIYQSKQADHSINLSISLCK
jgi:cell division FtsZ-interacting protein ZapD